MDTLTTDDIKYNAIHKENQLVYGKSNKGICIVTGWLSKDYVKSQLDENDYTVIGNLYSAERGIDFLVRNLLANPGIKIVLLLASTREDVNAGSVQCFYDFFNNGWSCFNDGKRECYKINSDINGYIEADILPVHLEELRESVICLPIFTNLIDLKESIDNLSNSPSNLLYFSNESSQCLLNLEELINQNNRQSVLYIKKEYETKEMPGNIYGNLIKANTIAEGWIEILHIIRKNGIIRPTGYDGKWQELINLQVVISDKEGIDEESLYFPKPNYLPIDRDYIKTYKEQILNDIPDELKNKPGVKYTYGQRLRSWFGKDQIEQVINKIVNEKDAASAVMSLWDINDHEKGGSPCLNHIWIRIINNRLILSALFRSNDMGSAWHCNAMGLRLLQSHILSEVNRINQEKGINEQLSIGELITISQSAHLYDDYFLYADNIVEKYFKKKQKNKEYSDPVGNFIIYIDNDLIIVEQISGKELIKKYEFKGGNINNMIDILLENNPTIEKNHIAYLASELTKAVFSIKRKKSFLQDQIIK